MSTTRRRPTTAKRVSKSVEAPSKKLTDFFSVTRRAAEVTPGKKPVQRRLFGAKADDVDDLVQEPPKSTSPSRQVIDFSQDDVSPRKVPRTPSRGSATPNRRLVATPHRVPQTPGTVPCTPSRILDDYVFPPEVLETPRTCSKVDRLTLQVKCSQESVLPVHLELLHGFFGHMEKIVSMRHDKMRTTFEEVQKAVEGKMKKSFTESHLAQILHLYPTAYDVRREESQPMLRSPLKNRKLDLVIRANLKDDLAPEHWRPDSPSKASPTKHAMVSPVKLVSPIKGSRKAGLDYIHKTPTKVRAVPVQREAEVDKAPKLEAWRMECRRKIFKHKLATYVQEHHEAFLQERGISAYEEDKHAWKDQLHADFDLTSVPRVPEDRSLKLEIKEKERTTARGVLSQVSDGSVPASVEKTIAELSPRKSCHMATPVRDSGAKTPTQGTPSRSASKSPSRNILEKLKQQDKAKAVRALSFDPEDEVRTQRLRRLEKTVPVVCSCYRLASTGVARTSMALQELYDKIKSSVNLTRDELKVQLKLLTEIAPNTCTLVEASGNEYFQLKESPMTCQKPMMNAVAGALPQAMLPFESFA